MTIPDPHPSPVPPAPIAVPAPGAPAAQDPAALARRLDAAERQGRELARALAALRRALGDQAAAAARSMSRTAGQVADLDEDAAVDPFLRAFPAKITGSSSGLFTWREQSVAGSSSLSDFTDGRSCNSFSDTSVLVEVNGWQDIAAGTVVIAVESEDLDDHRYHGAIAIPAPPDRTLNYTLLYDGSSKAIVWGTGGAGAGNLRAVWLNNSGGSDGDGTTPPSYTYDVYADSGLGTLLASGQGVVWARQHAEGGCTPGTHGVGLFDDSGTFVSLWQVDESWAATSCS